MKGMSLKKKLGYVAAFLLGVVVTLIVGFATSLIIDNLNKDKVVKEKITDIRKITYLDASGYSHTFELQAGNKCMYDVKNFKMDGQSIYDTYGPLYEADLKGVEIDEAKYPKTKGLRNTHIGYLDDKKVTYEDSDYTSRMGIDVSYHQGDIDWEKVKSSGVEFVYIRCGYRGYASEGALKEDSKFEEYYKGAKKAGLDVGVYFFAQAVNEREAKEEADFVLSLLKGKKLDLPVVYDPETVGAKDARTNSVTGEQFTANSLAFIKRVEEKGFKSALYANMIWQAKKLDMTKLTGVEMWYADYEPLPQSPYDFKTWQYSATGRIPGIKGDVDLDLEIVKK
jgi:GH25 family lysozyme M1 (1,4-beta-N-acetylmuramidase)